MRTHYATKRLDRKLLSLTELVLAALLLPSVLLTSLDFSHEISTALHYSVPDSRLQSGRVSLKSTISHALGMAASIRASMQADAWIVHQPSLFGTKEAQQVSLEESRIHFYAFPIENMEMRLGKVRIDLGKSDFFRHLDCINAPNFEDPLSFDRRNPHWLWQIRWNISFSASWELFWGPGRASLSMPPGESPGDAYAREMESMLKNLGGIESSLTANYDMHDLALRDSMWGSLFKVRISDLELSLLALSRINPYPVPESVAFSASSSEGTLSLDSKRFWLLGSAFTFDLGGIGIRGELAVKKYAQQTLDIIMDGTLLQQENMIGEDWFALYSLGFDYQFADDGPYCNLELSHGFSGEWKNGRGEGVYDYLVLSMEQKADQDRWTFALSLGLSGDLDKVDNADFFRRSSSWFVMPSVKRLVGENISLEISAMILEAYGGTTLGSSIFDDLFSFRCIARF